METMIRNKFKLKPNNSFSKTLFIGLLSLSSLTTFANSTDLTNNWTKSTVEELRISAAEKKLPRVVELLSKRTTEFSQQVNKALNLTALTQVIILHGNGLWQDSVKLLNQRNDFDDRSLYWSRLKMTKALRTAPAFINLLTMQQQQLLWKFELLSRGQQDIKFNKNADKKILITGFDPFFLDKNIDQSNPSGVTALALDDLFISNDGQSAEIESLIVPVRFADFDQGMIEQLLTPYFSQVDMIITISMGRKDFDLERFPGLRRSANAPGNLNIYTGANSQKPLIPLLNNKPLAGPEFVEFSLPVTAMQKAIGDYKINDNHKITTMEKTFEPVVLSELAQEISVQGSGGGYLSNEISYRSILLRNKYNSQLPVGHIHTPRIKAFEPKTSAKIVKQIKQMLTQAIKDI